MNEIKVIELILDSNKENEDFFVNTDFREFCRIRSLLIPTCVSRGVRQLL